MRRPRRCPNGQGERGPRGRRIRCRWWVAMLRHRSCRPWNSADVHVGKEHRRRPEVPRYRTDPKRRPDALTVDERRARDTICRAQRPASKLRKLLHLSLRADTQNACIVGSNIDHVTRQPHNTPVQTAQARSFSRRRPKRDGTARVCRRSRERRHDHPTARPVTE